MPFIVSQLSLQQPRFHLYNIHAIYDFVAFLTATTLSLVIPSRQSSPMNAFLCNLFSVLKPREPRRTLNVHIDPIHSTICDVFKFNHIVVASKTILVTHFIKTTYTENNSQASLRSYLDCRLINTRPLRIAY